MGNFVFITGGARSGKSAYAQKLAKRTKKKVAFIATCQPGDKEMKKRIELHKKSRPRHWRLIEEPKDVEGVLRGLGNTYDGVVIDCIGVLVSNLLCGGLGEEKIKSKMEKMARTASASKCEIIVVSNEVGDGIVPKNHLARRFRDVLGTTNQIMARHADVVYSMRVGIPVRIK